MSRTSYAAAIAALLLASVAAPLWAADMPPTPSYKIVATVPLGAPEKWDFVYFDPSSNRVFVSHRTKVDVVDVAQRKLVGEISSIGESHGVVTVPALNRGYADDAAAKNVVIFDLKTLANIATAPADTDSDAMVFDPATNRVFVLNADGNSVSAIDADKNATVKTVALGGAPEMAAVDGRGKLYINIASTNEIVAFDAKALAVTARWAVPTCTKPHGLAMDPETNRLFVSCVNAKMIVVNADSGAIIADLPIGKGTDSAAFDSQRKLAFSSNGEGTLSVIAEQGAEKFVSLGEVKTLPGARTMAVDPKTGRIFLVTADVAGTANEPGHGPHFTFTPGSAKLVILEPAN